MYPYHQFAPTSRSEANHKAWLVDVVRVAGAIELKKFVEVLVRPALPAPWAKTLESCLAPEAPETWCNCKSDKLARAVANAVQSTELRIVQDAAPKNKPIFVRCTDPDQQSRVKITSQAFLVEKSRTPDGKVLARVVMSCKELNDFFGRPPKVDLPQLFLIFVLVQFFPNPYFATADFRHYFYQFTLPELVRHFFAVITGGGDTFLLAVWPMGFSWTPWMAQSSTMLLLYEVRRRWEVENGLPVTKVPDRMEAYVTIRDRDGLIRAFLLAFYDNLLVIADAMKCRTDLVRIANAVVKEFNVKLKHVKESQTWSQSEKEVEYLGIRFSGKVEAKCWYWCHAGKQLPKWSSRCEVLRTCPRTQDGVLVKAQDLAGALGVIFWDLHVSGLPRATLAGLVELARRLGRAMSGAHSWATVVSVAAEDIKILLDQMETLLKNDWRQRYERAEHPISSMFWLACDASDVSGAGIRLLEGGNHELIWSRKWSKEEAMKPINWRETVAVIESLKRIAPTIPQGATVVVAEDNTTAKKAVNACFYPEDPQLCAELWTVIGDQRFGSIEAYYIPTAAQPADEYTRGLIPSKEKVARALEHLKSQLAADPRLAALQGEKSSDRSSSKRPRDG